MFELSKGLKKRKRRKEEKPINKTEKKMAKMIVVLPWITRFQEGNHSE